MQTAARGRNAISEIVQNKLYNIFVLSRLFIICCLSIVLSSCVIDAFIYVVIDCLSICYRFVSMCLSIVFIDLFYILFIDGFIDLLLCIVFINVFDVYHLCYRCVSMFIDVVHGFVLLFFMFLFYRLLYICVCRLCLSMFIYLVHLLLIDFI